MNQELFTLFQYSVTGYVLFESAAVLITFCCVIAAIKENILTFSLGMIGTAMYFAIFFMQRVYSSMVLQVIFFAFNAYGLYKWTHPELGKSDDNNMLVVTILTLKGRLKSIVAILAITMLWGWVSSNFHIWFPSIFPEEAKYVYIDSFILASSLVAQYLMAIKKLESWVLWLLIDIVAAPFYAVTVGYTTGMLYFIFIFTATAGLMSWYKSYKYSVKTMLNKS